MMRYFGPKLQAELTGDGGPPTADGCEDRQECLSYQTTPPISLQPLVSQKHPNRASSLSRLQKHLSLAKLVFEVSSAWRII